MRNNVLEKIVDELISCKIVPEKDKELYAFGIYQGMYNKRRLKTNINKERVENMNGDIKEEAVQVTWKGTEITLKTLKTLVQTLLQNRNQIAHGEQNLKKLNIQNRQLESVKLVGSDVKTFYGC